MINTLILYIQKLSWTLIPLIIVFGWYSPILMVLTLICIVGPIVFSFSFGRAWCGNFCPRWSFSNSILSLISPQKSISRFLKSKGFRAFMFILLMSFFIYRLLQPHESLACVGKVFVTMMVLTTIVQIIFAIFLHPFAWCTFCPMGTAASFITKVKKSSSYQIAIGANCVSCGSCVESCPLQIDIPSFRNIGIVGDTDCMKCQKCTLGCPNKALLLNSIEEQRSF